MSFEAITVKKQHAIIAVPFDTILYMEKHSRQITIYVTDGKDICFYGKYDSVMPMLDERFAHPHKSYVINMQHIYRLGRQEAVMVSGHKIEMGGRSFGRLKRAYDEYIRENIRNRLGT